MTATSSPSRSTRRTSSGRTIGSPRPRMGEGGVGGRRRGGGSRRRYRLPEGGGYPLRAGRTTAGLRAGCGRSAWLEGELETAEALEEAAVWLGPALTPALPALQHVHELALVLHEGAKLEVFHRRYVHLERGVGGAPEVDLFGAKGFQPFRYELR